MICLIAAHDQHHVIGNQGSMPWYFPEDLHHFKELTLHQSVIMGRKTFESIGKALPNRENIIVTHNPAFQAKDCLVAHSLEEALELASSDSLFIIGGQTLFEQALDLADVLYLTEIDAQFQGDTYFPPFKKEDYGAECLKTTTHPYHAKFMKYTKQ